MGRWILQSGLKCGKNTSSGVNLKWLEIRCTGNGTVGSNPTHSARKAPHPYMGAHKTVILKITIMASVRQGWQRTNGYLVKAGYPLVFYRHEKQ